MRKIWNKGHRIRASDKHLVYHFSIGMLLFIFVTVLLLLNMKQLMCTDWEHFSLLENGLTLSPYNFITILIATGVCALVAFLYYRFCYDSFKKLLHRQKLARMILENKWYEADTVQDSGFFTDLQSRSREKIVWFPKIYYQMEKGLLHIRCPRSIICFIIISLLICCTPQSVCPMTMTSSIPSSKIPTKTLRTTLPKAWLTTPPAFLMIFTSPFLIPRAAGKSSVSLVSIQVIIAIFLSGYLLVLYCSYFFSSTNSLLYFKISSIIASTPYLNVISAVFPLQAFK